METKHVAATAVIGLQWGDEAKGKIVDLLTDQHDIVVRYQGGNNAGHTVVMNGQTYKLGAFNPAAYAMWEPEIQNFGGVWGSNGGFDASQFPDRGEGIGHRHKKGAVIMGFSSHVRFIKFEEFDRNPA